MIAAVLLSVALAASPSGDHESRSDRGSSRSIWSDQMREFDQRSDHLAPSARGTGTGGAPTSAEATRTIAGGKSQSGAAVTARPVDGGRPEPVPETRSEKLEVTPVALADDGKAIGFDDMRYAPQLGKALIPGGRTGKLFVVDPKTAQVTSIAGFSSSGEAGTSHSEGITSADEGGGYLFVIDRTARELVAVDEKTHAVAVRAKLAAGPDYVRWVDFASEVWVTEPHAQSIEVFSFATHPTLMLRQIATVKAEGGPESLAIDPSRNRAYTHTWKSETMAIDLKTHAVVAKWKNGCEGSRGIALDATKALLFVGCEEGRVSVLDVAHDGKLVTSAPTPKGIDIISLSPDSQTLYVPGGDDAQVAVFKVRDNGSLEQVTVAPTQKDSECVVAAGAGAFVCDPEHGRVLWVHPGK